MIGGIITTPTRQQYLTGVVADVAPHMRELRIFNDEHRRGHWWNLERCATETLHAAGAGEPVFIGMDDTQAALGWHSTWQKIHREAQARVYVLFNRRRYIFRPENLERGWARGSWPGGFYDHAFIVVGWPTLFDDALRWYATGGKGTMNPHRAKHLDVVVQAFLVANGEPWVVTTPSLFDHIGHVSALGHDIGGSPHFAGGRP